MPKCNEFALWHVCFPVNSLHIFRSPFPKNLYGGLLLKKVSKHHLFPSKSNGFNPSEKWQSIIIC